MLRVRYRPNELGESGVIDFLPVDEHKVTEDDTVLLFRRSDGGKLVRVGHLKSDRWESVLQVEDANDYDD